MSCHGTIVLAVVICSVLVLLMADPGLAQSKIKGTMNLAMVRADMKEMDPKVAEAIKTYDAAKAGGKDVSGAAQELAEVVLTVAEHVDRSLAIDNQPADEPTLVQACEKLKGLVAEMEKRGIWTCYRPGEAALVAKVYGQWKNYRKILDDAVLLARAGGQADAEAELAKQQKAGDEGKGLAGLGKHPAFARAQAELARLKGQAPAVAKTDDKPATVAKTDDKPATVAKTDDKPPMPAKTDDKPAAPAKTQDAPPADLKQGRGSMHLSTVANVLRNLKKGAKPDLDMFKELLRGYEGSIITGWDERTPNLVEARKLIEQWYPQFEKEARTCYRPDEPPLAVDGAPVYLRAQMDKLLANARERHEWARKPQNASGAAQTAKTIAEECEGPLAQYLKQCQESGKPANADKHPAVVRVSQELAQLKADCLAVTGMVAGAQQGAEDAGKLCAALVSTLGSSNPQAPSLVSEDCRGLFEHAVRMVQYPDTKPQSAAQTPDHAGQLLKLMPKMDKEVLPEIQKFAQKMRDTYGADEATFTAKMTALKKDAGQNSPTSYYLDDAWPKLVKLEKAVKNLPAIRDALIASVLKHSADKYDQAYKRAAEEGEYDLKMRVEAFTSLAPGLEAVLVADPQNAQAKELTDKIAKAPALVKELEAKAIDAADWVGRTKTFSGPGDAGELEKSVLELAKKQWVGLPDNKYTVLAVAITGEWYSHKKNLLGQTIQWGLPVRVATKRQSDQGTDIVKVWFLSALTMEEAEVKKAPPWSQFAVGDGYRMRQAKFDAQIKK